MLSILKKSLLSLTLTSILAGCGGGDSGSSSNTNSTPVMGSFKNALETGVYFSNSNAPQEYGLNGAHCANYANEYYYETTNTLIYGEASLPDSDFEQAAEWVESALAEAAQKMNTTAAEYFALRDNYSPSFLQIMLTEISESLEKDRMFIPQYYVWVEQLASNELDAETYDYIASSLLNIVYESNGEPDSGYEGLVDWLPEDYLDLSDEDKLQALVTVISQIAELEASGEVTSPGLTLIELPNDIDLWEVRSQFYSLEERRVFPVENYLYEAFKALSNDEQNELISYYLSWLQSQSATVPSLDEVTYKTKLYVCLTNNTQSSTWGEGTRLGISFSAPSVYSQKNAEQTIVHELIHTYQLAFTSSPVTFSFLPRWLLEGQAVYLSGQNIAKLSNYANYDPVSVVNYYDEYGDIEEAYEHYGLAYSYIHENNDINNIKQAYEALNGLYSDATFSDTVSVSSTLKEQFELYLKDKDGNALSYDDFKQNYYDYMSNWNK